ncbi:MAG: glycosyltransferase family 4 protein [Chloroflexota bacterium]
MTGKVVVVNLGRSEGMGEARRLATWVAVAEAAGAEVIPIALLPFGRPRLRDALRRGAHVLTARAVPESLAWNSRAALDEIRRLDPVAVVCVTSRTYDPSFHKLSPVVILDFVDKLSTSYRDRAAVTGGVARLGWLSLAGAHRRFEARASRASDAVKVAAGRCDAVALDARWLPNVVEREDAVDQRLARFDLLFFGNLSYAPNIAAVRRLAMLWPLLVAERPGTTLLVAGARPVPEVERLCAQHGWTLRADFPDLRALCSSARLAIVPIDHAAGIQNKVLEAASVGLAQVLTPAVMSGLDTAFPAAVADDDAGLVREAVALLDGYGRREGLAAAALGHVRTHYAAAAWTSWFSTATTLPAGTKGTLPDP